MALGQAKGLGHGNVADCVWVSFDMSGGKDGCIRMYIESGVVPVVFFGSVAREGVVSPSHFRVFSGKPWSGGWARAGNY